MKKINIFATIGVSAVIVGAGVIRILGDNQRIKYSDNWFNTVSNEVLDAERENRRLRNATTRINTYFFLQKSNNSPQDCVKIELSRNNQHTPGKELHIYGNIQSAFFGRCFCRLSGNF